MLSEYGTPSLKTAILVNVLGNTWMNSGYVSVAIAQRYEKKGVVSVRLIRPRFVGNGGIHSTGWNWKD